MLTNRMVTFYSYTINPAMQVSIILDIVSCTVIINILAISIFRTLQKPFHRISKIAFYQGIFEKMQIFNTGGFIIPECV